MSHIFNLLSPKRLPPTLQEGLRRLSSNSNSNVVYSLSHLDSLIGPNASFPLPLRVSGRFGLGFNCVYHFTDVPSFVSGDYLVTFDPHAR